MIAHEPHGAYIANPRFSPDGTRIVATRFDGQRFRIVVLDARRRPAAVDAARPATIRSTTPRGWTTAASSSSAARRATPASRSTTTTSTTGRIDKLTHAPFLAFQPNAADGRTLRFLNREGWRWTLDEIPLPPRAPPPAPAPPPPAAARRRGRHPARRPTRPATPAAHRRAAARRAAESHRRAPPVEPPPPAAVATNVIPTVVADEPASAIDHLFVPHLYGPTFTRPRPRRPVPGRGAAGRRPASKPPLGARRLLPVHRGRPRRRLVRLLEPAARAADAVARGGAVLVHGRPARPERRRHAERLRVTRCTRRERELTFDALRAVLRKPGLARVLVHRELSPRRSRGAGAAAPHRRPPPVRVVRGRRDGALHRRAAGCSSRRSTSPRTRATGTRPASASSTCAASWPPPCRCRCIARHTLTLDARRARSGRRRRRANACCASAATSSQTAVRAGRPARNRRSTSYPVLPPGALFVEPLRGFEDYPFAVDRIAIGSATLPAAVHHRLRLGFDAVAAAVAVRPADRSRSVRRRRHRRAARGAPAHRRGRLADVAPGDAGSSRSPSSTSWRAASRTIRRWCT